MDEESKELVQAVTEAGVGAFVRTLFGPLAEASAWGADSVRWLRFRTQVKILKRAEAMLDEAGLATTAVPAKILVPLLDLGGLEDEADDEMHDRWAALLANAGAAAGGAEVQPSFSRFLSELTPADANALDWLGSQRLGVAPNGCTKSSDTTRSLAVTRRKPKCTLRTFSGSGSSLWSSRTMLSRDSSPRSRS